MRFNRISDIRESEELTQEQLSKIIGGSRVSISKWENQKDFPNIQKMNTMADYFHISLDYIFNFSKTKNYPDNKVGALNKKIVGKRLREVRIDNKLSLRKLASELNTTFSTLSAYETGKTLLLTAFAIQICKKYDISMDWLYGKKDRK